MRGAADNLSIGSGAAAPGARIAVIGSGVSGLSAAWLLGQRHEVHLFEADHRIGGHSNTVVVDGQPVDTGFIVFNEATYPNLIALFDHLGVASRRTDMGFAVTLDEGRLEYAGGDIGGLFAQKRNLVSPRFWSMLGDLVRFYRAAPGALRQAGDLSLDGLLREMGIGAAFRDDHLYPMAAAIWSTPVARIGDYPAAAFVRFCENHGLLSLGARPAWRTVEGGSRCYVEKLAATLAGRIATATPVRAVRRHADGVDLRTDRGEARFDHVVIAAHADQALAMLDDADEQERATLGAFGYRANAACLHGDAAAMPRRRRAWSAWNYASRGGSADPQLSVTYWMNRLQGWLPRERELFVTLNPLDPIDARRLHAWIDYAHPVFDAPALRAQGALWGLQGRRRTWFCGAHFGAGFHEDGLQAGLAVAEQLGGVRRPWRVIDESGRITITPRDRSSPDCSALPLPKEMPCT
ncbi:MAG: FAD-dependent oxidoreductase [Sphingomonadales bacterium]|nr:FAD-dependent oxidoreductase [Sphingomonadales bacterium]